MFEQTPGGFRVRPKNTGLFKRNPEQLLQFRALLD